METDAAEASDEPPSALRSENGVGSGACAGQGVLGNDGRLVITVPPGTDRCRASFAAAEPEPEPDDSGGSPAPGVAAQSGPADAASAPQTLALAPGGHRSAAASGSRIAERKNRAEDPGFDEGSSGAPEEANATRAYDAKNESAARAASASFPTGASEDESTRSAAELG